MDRLANNGAAAPGIRYHYMDNLRAIAMLAGVFFHAALAYSPAMSQVWLTSDPQTSPAIDVVSWFMHLFRMPLFFLIAGFFACYLVEKRGAAGFMKNRAVRILVPFVLFLPLIWISLAAGVGWALANVENPSPLLRVFAWMANVPDAPPPPITTTHLWFLYNLCMFYVVYVALEKTGVLSMKWAGVFSSPKFLVFVLPLLIAPALAGQWKPHPAPEQFVPQLWSFGFYGFFFLVGAQFFRRKELIDELRPWVPWLTATSLVLYAVLYYYLPKSVTLEEAIAVMQGVPIDAREAGLGLLEAVIAVHMTLVCLVAGKRFMDRASPAVRYIADSSYWVYIVHLPLVFFIQYLLLDTEWNLWIEFAISSFGTLAIGLISYAILVRYTPIGWLLNGRRGRQQEPSMGRQAQEASA